MRHSEKAQYTKTEKRSIYILLFPLSKQSYISHCRKDLLKSVYQDHLYGERYQTKRFISELKEKNLHPCLFSLEELSCTKVEAFSHVVAWTKIFSDAGYVSLNQGNVSVYIDDLHGETFEIYKKRKKKNISDLITCDRCLVSNYARQKCPMFSGIESAYVWGDDGEHTIQVKTYVTENELKQIKKNASACNKTVSAYVREVALNMCTIPIDYTVITEHTDELSAYRNAVNQLIYTIKKTGNYVPADLEYILAKTNEMLKSEKQFRQDFDALAEKTKKDTVKTVKNTVRNHLSPKTKSFEESNKS